MSSKSLSLLLAVTVVAGILHQAPAVHASRSPTTPPKLERVRAGNTRLVEPQEVIHRKFIPFGGGDAPGNKPLTAPIKTLGDFLKHPIFGAPGMRPMGDKNAGTCAACTVVLSIIEGLVKVNEKPVDKVVAELCDYIPISPLKDICTDIIKWFGPLIIAGLERKDNPDVICRTFQLCKNPTCQLWPSPAGSDSKSTSSIPTTIPKELASRLHLRANESPWQWLENLINRFSSNHDPLVDLDKDNFGTEFGLRGTAWRGKDCDDLDNTTYPGRIPVPPYTKDVNCNGIFGVDPKGVPYEDLLCANTSRNGIIVIGDSVGAHFELPPQWFHPASINKTTYDDVIQRLENEFDLPYRGLTTGYDLSVGNVTSLYLHNRNNNLCLNNDYQNLGVNGMASHDMMKLVKSIKRDPVKDHPVTVIFELVGNDVCARKLSDMTSPQDFYNNNLASMQYLDTILPKGSHVIFIGLADGRVLWDSLHDREHPIGVKYSAVYEWLTCLDLNPCTTWLNWNETVRDATTARAVELSATYQQLLQQNFTNFDMAYYDFPFNKIIGKWKAEGGQAWELIEPVDGFHPNQVANYLIAQDLITQIGTDHPDWLASVNPQNSLITELFGIKPIVYGGNATEASYPSKRPKLK